MRVCVRLFWVFDPSVRVCDLYKAFTIKYHEEHQMNDRDQERLIIGERVKNMPVREEKGTHTH